MIFYQDVIQVEPGMIADYLTALGEKAPPPLFERGSQRLWDYCRDEGCLERFRGGCGEAP